MINNILKAHRNKIIILFHHISLIAGLVYFNFSWPYVVLSVLSGYVMFAIFGHGGHLLISHKKYKDTWYNACFTFGINLFTASGGAFNFTALHRHHHKHADTELDPHSPTYIGGRNVYLLFWKNIKINPTTMRDMARSRWIMILHRHQVKMHFLGVILLAIIDPRLVFFVVSPSVIYTIHVNGLVNWLGHKNGQPRNIPEIAWLTPLSWRHGDHHKH